MASTMEHRPQPPSFEDLGIPLVSQTRTTLLGKIRSLSSLDLLEWLFLLASLLAALATLGLGIARLVTLPPHDEDRVFVWLLFITTGFSMIYAVNGVLREQVYELLVYAVTAVVLTLYVLINYLDPETPRGAIKLARLVVACILSPPLVAAACTLAVRYFRRGALVFRTVGANVELQAACRCVLTAQSLLKLDAQLALSTVLLILPGGGGVSKLEAAVLAAGCVITMLWWVAGYAALRWERRPLLWAVVATAPLEPAYILWKLATDRRPDTMLVQCGQAAGGLALLVRLLLVICLIRCAKGFGLGVNQHMYPGGEQTDSRPARYGSFSNSSTSQPGGSPSQEDGSPSQEDGSPCQEDSPSCQEDSPSCQDSHPSHEDVD